MPFWLWISCLVVLLLLIQAVAIWVAAAVVRARIAPRRAIAAALLIAGVNIVSVALGVLEGSSRAFLVGIVSLVLSVAIVRWAIRRGWWRSILVYIVVIAIHLPLAFGVRTLMARTFAETFVASSEAMVPTLEPGDRFIMDPSLTPRRWDLVVFAPPSDPSTRFVFRIAGMPGETVEIVGGRLEIDGRDITVPPDLAGNDYTPPRVGLYPANGVEGSPLTLGTDQYFVVGDNPPIANDSRLWPEAASPGVPPGALPRQNIKGVVRLIYAPRVRVFR